MRWPWTVAAIVVGNAILIPLAGLLLIWLGFLPGVSLRRRSPDPRG